jgi:hypothetical protein
VSEKPKSPHLGKTREWCNQFGIRHDEENEESPGFRKAVRIATVMAIVAGIAAPIVLYFTKGLPDPSSLPKIAAGSHVFYVLELAIVGFLIILLVFSLVIRGALLGKVPISLRNLEYGQPQTDELRSTKEAIEKLNENTKAKFKELDTMLDGHTAKMEQVAKLMRKISEEKGDNTDERQKET